MNYLTTVSPGFLGFGLASLAFLRLRSPQRETPARSSSLRRLVVSAADAVGGGWSSLGMQSEEWRRGTEFHVTGETTNTSHGVVMFGMVWWNTPWKREKDSLSPSVAPKNLLVRTEAAVAQCKPTCGMLV